MLFGRRPPGRSALCGVHSDDEADGGGIPQALSDVLVCPLSKKRLRYCEASGSLVSDAVGVSFPIVAGLPCLVPKDGKSLEDHQEKSEECGLRDSSTVSEKLCCPDTPIRIRDIAIRHFPKSTDTRYVYIYVINIK